MNGEWQTKKLAEVATLQRGFDLPTRERTAGAFPLVSSSGITDTHYKSAVRGPGVATGRSGSIGNVFFMKDDFWPLNTVLYVKDFHGNDQRFIFYLLQHFDLSRFATGVGVPTLNRNFVHDEIVRIPDLPEQRRIAGILDKAFAAIATAKANTEKNLQNARASLRAYAEAIFTLNDGWPTKQLGEVCRFQGGSQPPKSQFVYSPRPGYVRFLQIRDFATERHITYIPISDKNRMCTATDLLIGRYGASVGKILTGKAGAYNVALMKATPDQGVLDSTFFFHYLTSSAFQRRLAAVADRSAQNGFAKDDISGFPVPTPPLSDQRAILARIRPFSQKVGRLASIFSKRLDAVEALRLSLLDSAFRGDL